MSGVGPDAGPFDCELAPGSTTTVSIAVSESYAGADISIPALVWQGREPGPTVAILAAVHGDEINGTGVIRRIVRDRPFDLLRGRLIVVPVVNIFGFERHSRYLPDRRDLNRCFPGSPTGSLASRLAHAIFETVIRRCDYCIDLHSAAVRRTNFPNVRADLTDARLAPLARAFGAELIIDSPGPIGSLRRTATEAGCATLVFEAGEAWKVEAGVVAYSLRGILQCLDHLGMIEADRHEPAYRLETNSTRWVRAQVGGFLEFHVSPGDVVQQGDPLATNTTLLGDRNNMITAPRGGVVVGMTTLPAVAPGDPVCHLAFPREGELPRIERAVEELGRDSLHERFRDDLSRNIDVTQP